MANTLIFETQTITDDHIFGGVNYLADLNTGEEFTIGNTASASVSFVTDIRLPLYTKDSTNGRFSRTENDGENLADDSSNLLVTDDSQFFAIDTPRGRFFITETTKGDGFYTIKAYDAMILLETNISALSLTFPLTVSAAASAIATYIGCTVSGTIYNGTLSVEALDDDMTIRELLGYVAEASGCSVKIDETGHLCFMYYEDSGISLTASDYKKLEVADYTCAAIDNVTILNSVGAAVATAGEGTNSLYVSGNPFLEEATDAEAEVILDRVSGFEYAPLTCEMFDENELQVGTIATFGTTPTLVMHIESSESGAVASSVGSDSRAEYNKNFETMLAAVTKQALDAADEASTKATKYITKIDNAGIKVHAYNDITHTPDDSNYAKINSDGMEIYKGGSSVAKYGDEARIGASSSKNVLIDTNGIYVKDASTDLAIFGTETRIGKREYGKYHIVLDSSGLKVCEESATDPNEDYTYVKINNVGVDVGAVGAVMFGPLYGLLGTNAGTIKAAGVSLETDNSYIVNNTGGLYNPTSSWLVYTDGSNHYTDNDFGPMVNSTNGSDGYYLGWTQYRWNRVFAYTAENVVSDRKHKDVIGDLDFAKELIMSLEPVEFQWKGSDHKRSHMGLIAQDAAEAGKAMGKDLAFYEAQYSDGSKYHGEEADDNDLQWGMTYTELVAPIIKVLQEQEETITKLSKRIEALEKRQNGE